jgi:hypothetical protein
MPGTSIQLMSQEFPDPTMTVASPEPLPRLKVVQVLPSIMKNIPNINDILPSSQRQSVCEGETQADVMKSITNSEINTPAEHPGTSD